MPYLAVSFGETSSPHFFFNSIEESIESTARLGYDGVDMAVSNAEEVFYGAALCDKYGLRIGTLMTSPLWSREGLSLSDPGTADKAVEHLALICEEAAKSDASVVIGSVLGRLPAEDPSRGERRKVMVDALRDVVEHARRLDVELLIEPLNHHESNALCLASETISIMDDLGLDSSLVVDCFHASIEEADVDDVFRNTAPRVGLVHLADSQRTIPGGGYLPLERWISALREGGYRGRYTVEAFLGTAEEAMANAGRALAFCRDRGL